MVVIFDRKNCELGEWASSGDLSKSEGLSGGGEEGVGDSCRVSSGESTAGLDFEDPHPISTFYIGR